MAAVAHFFVLRSSTLVQESLFSLTFCPYTVHAELHVLTSRGSTTCFRFYRETWENAKRSTPIQEHNSKPGSLFFFHYSLATVAHQSSPPCSSERPSGLLGSPE
uniref:(northern house mosquito) hypothetical protein n=1 Tax=Culex pipiens TaxID=7175 RepID=A0A8D8B6D0_CULPI